MEEAYRAQVRQVMDAAGWHWPEHLLLDPARGPRFLESAAELLHELQLGTHMDEVLVLPDGVEKLGGSALDPRIQQALGIASTDDADDKKTTPASTAYQVLERLSQIGMLGELRGKISFRLDPNERKEERASGGPSLLAQWQSLAVECPEEMRHTVYVSEMRRLEAREHTNSESSRTRRWRKTSMIRTMRESAVALGLDARDMVYWDDYSEGTFIGGDQAGYKIHVDCVQTSNIGSMYAGHKLLAIWKYPKASYDVLEQHLDTHFVPPLSPVRKSLTAPEFPAMIPSASLSFRQSPVLTPYASFCASVSSGDHNAAVLANQEQEHALEGACKVVLAPPGCVYLFSGCNAHAVINVGWTAPAPDVPPVRTVCLSSYEALCGLHPVHARAVIGTHDSKLHHPECWMDTEEDLEDFEEDLAFNINNLERRLADGQVGGGIQGQAVREAIEVVRRSSSEVDRLCRTRPWRGGRSTEADCGSEEEREVSDLGELLHRKKQRRIEAERQEQVDKRAQRQLPIPVPEPEHQSQREAHSSTHGQ